MLGIHGSHSNSSMASTPAYATVYGFGTGYGSAFDDNQDWYTGESVVYGSFGGGGSGGGDGNRRLRYSSDGSFA